MAREINARPERRPPSLPPAATPRERSRRNERERLIDRDPLARRDPFLALRARGAVLRFHQKEVADLVDQLSAEAKVPVDGRELAADDEIGEPVSSATSRSAAASGSSCFSRCPFGNPQFR